MEADWQGKSTSSMPESAGTVPHARLGVNSPDAPGIFRAIKLFNKQRVEKKKPHKRSIKNNTTVINKLQQPFHHLLAIEKQNLGMTGAKSV